MTPAQIDRLNYYTEIERNVKGKRNFHSKFLFQVNAWAKIKGDRTAQGAFLCMEKKDSPPHGADCQF